MLYVKVSLRVSLTGADGLLLIHLPNGPTAHFKLTSFRRGREIRVRSKLHKSRQMPTLTTKTHTTHKSAPVVIAMEAAEELTIRLCVSVLTAYCAVVACPGDPYTAYLCCVRVHTNTPAFPLVCVGPWEANQSHP